MAREVLSPMVVAVLPWVSTCLAAQDHSPGRSQVAIYSVFTHGREWALTPVPVDPAGAATGQAYPLNSYAPLRVALSRKTLEFHFGPDVKSSAQPIRVRYRLEGFDDGWRELGGSMSLHLRYLTTNNQAIGSDTFERQGQSKGWNGRIDSSPFMRAVAQSTVPALADRMQVALLCGQPSSTGIWGARNLRVWMGATDEQWKVLRTLSTETGDDLSNTQGTPRDWTRTGNNWNVSKLFSGDTPSNPPVLALIDDDPRGGGGWVSVHMKVVPHQRIQVEWEEVYTIGQSGAGQQSYRELPIGRYTFAVQATDEGGYPTSPECRLPIALVPPFYQTGWFWSVSVLAFATLLVVAVRRSARLRLRAQAARARQQQLITEERMRIARDLHDDLGSGLTQIALLVSQATRRGAAGTPAAPFLERVAVQVRDLVLGLDQIVWAVSPGQDTMESLATYLCQFAGDLTGNASIRFWPKVPTFLPNVPLTSPMRYSLLIAVKEALNNVVRHSQAKEVMLSFQYEPQTRQLKIEVADNGRGFTPAEAARGNGLANIESRLHKLGGTALIESQPGNGTRVRLVLPIPDSPSLQLAAGSSTDLSTPPPSHHPAPNDP